MTNKVIKMNSVSFSNDLPFVIIAGPDSLESLEHAMFMTKKIKDVTTELGIQYVFKASYDKANRTSIHSFRGVGLVLKKHRKKAFKLGKKFTATNWWLIIQKP